MTYLEYRTLIEKLMEERKTTGNDQSDEMIHYAEMNIQRMNRLDKTIVLSENWIEFLNKNQVKYNWIVLTEGWCGDAAQIVPLINKIAENSNGNITLDLLLRDENLELMDNYLTNGTRAIPKLICFDLDKNELWNWGPRPKNAQLLINGLKEQGMDMKEIKTDLHLWYTKNKTLETQNEILLNFH
jgi:hypothetical protein